MESKEAGDILLRREDFIRKRERISDTYEIVAKPLAYGLYGSVHEANHKLTKEARAVKVIPKYKLQNIAQFFNEVELLKLVDHPRIIRMYEWYEDYSNIYIVMDLCRGGELFDKIATVKYLNEQVAAQLFRDMMQAVNYCYNKKVCHKDLKPENFIFSAPDEIDSIKLIDFGLSQLFEDPSINLQRK